MHGFASGVERLAAVATLCRGDRRLGGAVHVVKLGRGRLIRGQWRAEELPLDPLASLADTVFEGVTPGPSDALVVGKARVYTMTGPGALPFDAPEAATLPAALSPESHPTGVLAERVAEALAAAEAPAPAAAEAAAAALNEAAAANGDDSDSEEDDQPIRRPSVR